MKKVFIILISVIFLGILLFSQNFRKKGGELGVRVLSQEEIDIQIRDKEFKVFDTPILFNGNEIAYDIDQNMILIPQKINGSFFEGDFSSDDKLYFLEDAGWKNKSESLEMNHVFRLFRISETQYWMYNVYFTALPIANISTVYNEGMDKEDTEKQGRIWVYDQYRSNVQFQESECIFHVRGASSREFPKKSYRVELQGEKLSLLGMRKDDDWILNSLYDDEGLIHNKISYDLWHQIASTNNVANDEGVKMEYVEVFMDHRYIGVYGLLERIDKKALELSIQDKLYKGVENKEVGVDDFYSELKADMKPVFEIEYPKEIKVEDWEPLKDWYYKLKKDNISIEEADSILNIENAIDYLLYNLYICNSDNTLKNIYYFADYQGDGSYRMIKIPWDLNMTWGNVWVPVHRFHFNQYQPEVIKKDWGWTEDMYCLYDNNPKEMGEIISLRWEELRKKIITKDNIYQLLDEQLAYLHSSGARKREELFWESRDEYWKDEYIYEYAEEKIIMMDEYINNLKNGKILQ